jgi:tRNA/tmRNA/rRNA uracil-C5-methylase (TrmA/RlmC/RlmD family)
MSNKSRFPAPCPHIPHCRACPRYGEPGIAPPAWSALATLAASHGCTLPPVVQGPPVAFRLRARLAIRGPGARLQIGLFEPGTHDVLAVPRCAIHHPLVNRVVAVVREALAGECVPAYSEATRAGVARYLQVVVERSSQSAQVVLVGNSATPAPLAGSLEQVRRELGPRLHSLWFNSQQGTGNAILGPHFEPVCGKPTVVEHFGGAAIHYPPGAFGQGNLEVATQLIGQLRAEVPVGSRVLELYAGVGAIGLSLLERTGDVKLNEVGEHSLQGLALGVAGLAEADRARVRVLPGTAGAAAAAVAGAEVVIADPPRRGLDAPLLEQLVLHPPERFLYVSCGLESLLADAAALTAGGRLRLAGLTAYNMMPYTGHVETVARFERA